MKKTINPQQLIKYRAEWGRVRKAMVKYGDFSPADAEAERKAIQREAIGSDKSSKDFTNAELNNVLDAFGKILVLFDGPSDRPSRNQSNLIWAIEHLGLADATITHIAHDAYGRSADWPRDGDWRKLPECRLTCLRYTCTRYARSLRKPDPA